MHKKYLILLLIILTTFVFTPCLEPAQIIIIVDDGIKIDEKRFKDLVLTIISTYSENFNLTLDKPLIIHITKNIRFKCLAYTEYRKDSYFIVTKTINFHVIAHELVHVFQYIRWKKKLDGIAEKWNWFVEGFADSIPIFLFNTTPVVSYAKLDTWNGLLNQYPHPLLDRNINKPYYTRIFFLYLFKINFTDTVKRYFSINDEDINPFHQMFINNTIRREILKQFWLNHTQYISTYKYYFYRPFIKYTGAEAIILPSKYKIITNTSCIIVVNINNTFIPYNQNITTYPAKVYIINLSNTTLRIILREDDT